MSRALHPYKNKTNYYEWLNHSFENKKNWIIDIFTRGSLNMQVLRPEGGYFIVASIKDAIPLMPIKYFYKDHTKAPIGNLEHFEDWVTLKDPDYTPDLAYCFYLIHEWKCAPTPMTAFFDNNPDGDIRDYKGCDLIRLPICKSNSTLSGVEDAFNDKEKDY